MRFSKIISFLACFLVLGSCVFRSPQKRAQKKLEKGKYEKAEKLLQKSVKKDSLNPAAHYLLSRLYLDTAARMDGPRKALPWEAKSLQNIDTSQYFILKALAELPHAEKKDLKRLRKIKADTTELLNQLARVDSAAFHRATSLHSIEGYNYFLNRYPEAVQTAEATRRRNALAFRAAEKENTYQSYQQFFQTYPQAAEAPEARELYEELLFISSTKTGTLQSYIRFLDAYPDTPYRNRLLKRIYLLSTAGHNAEQYASFIRQYPDNSYTRDAVNQLYHLHKENHKVESFLETYPQVPFKDSLEQVMELDLQSLVAVLEDGKWQFINETGNIILPPVFMDVHPDYTCQTIQADYVEAFGEEKPVVMAKNGSVILEQDYEMLDELGSGLLRIQQKGLKGLYLKSGKALLAPGYDQIEKFGPDLLRVKEYGRHGLLTYNGQWLAEPTYDSLARLEKFIMLYKDRKFAVTTAQQLIEALQQNKAPELDFKYSKASLADPNHLIVQNPAGQSGVLDDKLNTILPLTPAQISPFEGGWILKKNNRTQILGTNGEDLLEASFVNIQIREPWIAYKTDSLWGLYHIGLNKATFDLYDSLSLLHPNILVVHRDKQTLGLFFQQDTVSVDLSGIDAYRLLRPTINNVSDIEEQAYLLVLDGNARKVYNQKGRLLEQGRYKEIVAPDDQLLVLKTSRGAAIADSSGTILLKPIYDAVGNYQNGYFATLNNSKFGIFNPYKGVHIPPQYKVALRPYSDSLLMANKGKGWGIVDHKNKQVLNFDYEELQYWSDSVVLARKDSQWFLLNLHTGENKYGPFKDYKFLTQSPGESLAKVYTTDGYGIYSSRQGELISPVYDDILNLGTVNNPLFYAEKQVKEADLYVVVYINNKGETIYKKAYPREDWLRILCD